MRVCPHCHLHVSEAAHEPCDEVTIELVADVVPPGLSERFEDIRPFSRGNVGTSYLATQRASGRSGLLKLISIASVGTGSERTRLKRELRKQTTIDHPGLVPILDGGEHEGQLWLFREFVAGESLAARLQRVQTLDVEQTLAIVSQLASALDELHRQGLLHRDVKPRHVLLSPNGDAPPLVRLIDASLAPRHASSGVFDLFGTPAYMSPEQAANKLVSFRSDLYSLGCMTYEMLTGKPPFAGDTKALLKAHAEQKPAPLELALPERVAQLIGDLLAKEPRKRPFSAQQVRRTLEPFVPPGTPHADGRRRVPTAERSPAFKGASVPPRGRPAGGRGGSGARGPPVPPPPPLPGGRFESASPTEQIDTHQLSAMALDEIEQAAIEGRPITQELSTRELSSLAISERAGAMLPSRPPTQELSTEELRELSSDAPDAQDDDATILATGGSKGIAGAGRDDDQTMALDASDVEIASGTDDDSVPGGMADRDAGSTAPGVGPVTITDDDPTQALSQVTGPSGEDRASPAPFPGASPGASQPPQGATTARPLDRTPLPNSIRPAVDFDVESLFSDEVAPPRTTVEADGPQAEGAEASEPVLLPGRSLPWVPLLAGTAVLALAVVWVASGDAPTDEAAKAAGGPPEDKPIAVAAETPEPQKGGAAEAPVVPDPAVPKGADTDQAPPGGEEDATDEATADGEQPAEEPGADDAQNAEATPAEDTDAPAAGDKAKPESGKVPAPRAQPRAKAPAKPKPSSRKSVADYKDEARTHFRAKRFDQAAAAYRAASKAQPRDAGALAGLGASLLAAGKTSQAVSAYQRAIKISPSVSGFHAALGRAYLKKGDRSRAIAAYRKAVKLNPKNRAARAALKKLGVR